MMIKYKVNEVAKDLGVNSKKVIEVLDKYCGVQKKTTTTGQARSCCAISFRGTEDGTSQSFRNFRKSPETLTICF